MNNIKRLPALLMFAEVAKQQSFTLAAQKLGMSKSAVSQQIKRLEEELGQQLLSRHTRGMSLTATGEKLLDRCELLHGQIDLLMEDINNTKEQPSGPFAISIPHAIEKDVAMPALSQLCNEFPFINPAIQVTDASQDLIKHNLDVSIYAGELKDSNYRALPIGNAHEIFCATPAYVKNSGPLLNLDDLMQHKMVATSWQKETLAVYNHQDFSNKTIIKPNYFAKTNTLPSTLELILHDLGIGLLPEFTVNKKMAQGKLVRVLPKHQGRQWPFYMVHRFQGEKPAHVSRFYTLVKHFFAKTNV